MKLYLRYAELCATKPLNRCYDPSAVHVKWEVAVATLFYDAAHARLSLELRVFGGNKTELFNCELWRQTCDMAIVFTPNDGDVAVPAGHAYLKGNQLHTRLKVGYSFRMQVDSQATHFVALLGQAKSQAEDRSGPRQNTRSEKRTRMGQRQPRSMQSTESLPEQMDRAIDVEEFDDFGEEDLRRLRGANAIHETKFHRR
ncbi:hypothetical protein [Rhodoferax sp. GW822-FHT02A01]|uniref:hypothetical protein n=1 Tax=Rhodoferax sp. GW822-FHT02A01 TaxID=3141537 RepID=UPI00315DD5D3